MVEENNNEPLVELLNLYKWVAGLTKFGQNSCSSPCHEDPIICIEAQQY